MATNIYFNTAAQDPQNAVCLNEVNTGPSSILTMVLGSKIPVNLYFVDGEGAFDPLSGDATYSVKVGIGKLGQSSTGGTYTLSYGGNTTSALAYNASAATVSTALNLLASIVSAGGVTVSGTWPVLVVTFNSVGVRTAITGTQDALTPTSALIIDEFQVGDVSTVSKWGIENAISPPVYQTTWTPITNGWTAVLDLSTFELAASLAGVDATGMYFEARITDPSGNPRVWAQPLMLVRNRVINPGSLVPADRDSYLTAAEVRDGFVQNRFLVDGLTGGTSADLDGIPTAGAVATVGWMAAVVVANQLSFYRLESSTQAENSPTWIRPDDYNGTTNQRVWHLVGVPTDALTEYTAIGTFSATGGESITPSAGVVHSVYSVTLNSGCNTWLLSVQANNSTAGDLVLVNAAIAASGVSSFQIVNQNVGVLAEFDSDVSGLASVVSAVLYYDGSNWVLFSASRMIAGVSSPVITGWNHGTGTFGGRAYSYLSATSLDAVIKPNSYGAFMLNTPDGGLGGGNARGNYAIDLQIASRSAATQVASGPYSSAIGTNNTSSGQYSIAIGAANVASGNGASAVGYSCNAGGDYSLATGRSSSATRINQRSHGGVLGRQLSDFVLWNSTADATPLELYIDGVVTVLALSNQSTWTFEILVTAFCVASGESDGWRFFGVIHRGVNAAATAIVGTVVKEHVGSTVWDFDVDADTTNGSLRLMATGEAGKTVLWNSAVRTSEIN